MTCDMLTASRLPSLYVRFYATHSTLVQCEKLHAPLSLPSHLWRNLKDKQSRLPRPPLAAPQLPLDPAPRPLHCSPRPLHCSPLPLPLPLPLCWRSMASAPTELQQIILYRTFLTRWERLDTVHYLRRDEQTLRRNKLLGPAFRRTGGNEYLCTRARMRKSELPRIMLQCIYIGKNC